MSTPKSPNYQGRFGRMFRSLPAASYGATDAESRLALMTLGKAMTSEFDAPKDGFDGEESGIPSFRRGRRRSWHTGPLVIYEVGCT
jgi:hypothetical protein